jgi:hypothetical protein
VSYWAPPDPQRWTCACGADRLAGAFCPYCGRRNPSGELPPLPASVEAWLPPVAPPRVGLNAATVTLSALIALLLVVGGSVIAVRDGELTGATRQAFEQAVERGKDFVARYRGRPFEKDVEVRLLGDDDFTRLLFSEEDDDPAEDETDYEATLQALRLADPDEDLDEEEESLLSDTVVGFYDDELEMLVVRGGKVTPYVELTLVHELTHAWQDQHYDLSELWDGTETDDEALALRSLIEGDAQRTENAWREEQPASVRDEIERIEEGPLGDGGDDEPSRTQQSLNLLYGFPYEAGESFVDDLAEDGGNAALDEAFEDPPVSTAQVLDPDRYRAGNGPDAVTGPVVKGATVDRGTLGQVGLLVFLAGDEDLDREAFEASDGWDGDEYVTWRDGRKLCTTVSLRMDDRAERDELAAALRSRGVTSENVRDAALTFSSCVEE